MDYYKDTNIASIRYFHEGEMLTEEWKDIPNYLGLYQASSLGRIKSLQRVWQHPKGQRIFKEKIVAQTQNKWGYLYVELSNIESERKKYFAHVLCALTFIPNPENKPQVNHKLGVKDDNRITELEWNTRSENRKHAFRTGLQKPSKTFLGKKGALCPHSKAIVQFTLDGQYIRQWAAAKEAARELKLSQGNITSCCQGKYKSTGGFKFQYAA
jgi:hypothetical protein